MFEEYNFQTCLNDTCMIVVFKTLNPDNTCPQCNQSTIRVKKMKITTEMIIG